MNILKKTAGILLILFSIILGLAVLISFDTAIKETAVEIKKSTAAGLGYAFGSLIVMVLFVAIIYFNNKLALKLIKGKPNNKTNK